MIDFTTQQWEMIIMLVLVVGICYLLLEKYNINE
jgi:hypothetical protein